LLLWSISIIYWSTIIISLVLSIDQSRFLLMKLSTIVSCTHTHSWQLLLNWNYCYYYYYYYCFLNPYFTNVCFDFDHKFYLNSSRCWSCLCFCWCWVENTNIGICLIKLRRQRVQFNSKQETEAEREFIDFLKFKGLKMVTFFFKSRVKDKFV